MDIVEWRKRAEARLMRAGVAVDSRVELALLEIAGDTIKYADEFCRDVRERAAKG
jgi:hypothetical protein